MIPPTRRSPRRSLSREQRRLALMQRLFDASAERYEIDIAPVLMPLVTDFVTYLRPRPDDRALDLGTGTGLLARALAPQVRQVIGIDISAESLRVARAVPTARGVYYVRGDIQQLPVAPGGVTLIVTSLGLNGTIPDLSLRALRRALRPRGRLVVQEWGAAPPIDHAFEEVFEEYRVPDPGPPLRWQIQQVPPFWPDQLQDPADYAEWLTLLGFRVREAVEVKPVAVRLPDLDTYLRYKLAWTHRWDEVRAMEGPTRAAFFEALRARLATFTAPDGSLVWEPGVIRVRAEARPQR